MTSNKGGHPTADELTSRCAGTNRRGERCGLPPVAGLAVCRRHVVSTPSTKLLSVPDKLRELTDASLERLAEVIAHGKDADAVRAASLILGVTLPKTVLVGPAPVDEDGKVDPLSIIRARLDKLRAVPPVDDNPSTATRPTPHRPELPPAQQVPSLDLTRGAERPVDEPEPVRRVDVPEEPSEAVYGGAGVDDVEVIDAELVEEPGYGIPPQSEPRVVDIAAERFRRGAMFW